VAFIDDTLVEQIGQDARQVDAAAAARRIGRFLLTVIAGVLYTVGWTVRKVFVVGWLAFTWSWAAVRLGWREAAPKPRK
jgi:hypothetical protein